MTNNNRYQATKLGLRFTIVSALLTLTVIVPIFVVIPAATLEGFIASIVDNEPYSNVGKATLLVLSILFAISLAIVLFVVRRTSQKSELTSIALVLIMLLEFFIVHPLGLYIYWGAWLGFRSDGQLMFAVFTSFPLSSLSFLFIGWLIDLVKTNNRLPSL